VGVLTPTRALVATAEPAAVAPGAPFGLTVTFRYLSGLADTTFNGDVTVALASHLGGATLGGTLTVAAHNGAATFSRLTIDRAGRYRTTASPDRTTTTVTDPVTVAIPTPQAPPAPVTAGIPTTIVAEKALLAGKGRRRHLVGFELDFSAAMDPA